MERVMEILLVGIGGMIGSTLRYLVALTSSQMMSSFTLYPTLIVNLVGSLLIGSLLALGADKMGGSAQTFIVTGLLGGFTTYSAFSGDAFQLIKSGQYSTALIYVSATVIGGLVLTGFGFYLTKSTLS